MFELFKSYAPDSRAKSYTLAIPTSLPAATNALLPTLLFLKLNVKLVLIPIVAEPLTLFNLRVDPKSKLTACCSTLFTVLGLKKSSRVGAIFSTSYPFT